MVVAGRVAAPQWYSAEMARAVVILRHRQVAQACAASLGLAIGPVVITEEPLGVELARGTSGASWGTIQAVGALLRAGETALAGGATAVAGGAK